MSSKRLFTKQTILYDLAPNSISTKCTIFKYFDHKSYGKKVIYNYANAYAINEILTNWTPDWNIEKTSKSFKTLALQERQPQPIVVGDGLDNDSEWQVGEVICNDYRGFLLLYYNYS